MGHHRVLIALLAAIWSGLAAAQATIHIDTPAGRRAFYRDETPLVTITVSNSGQAPIGAQQLVLECTEHVREVIALPELANGSSTSSSIRLPLARLKAGTYDLRATLRAAEATTTEAVISISTVHRPNPDRLIVWLWGGGGSEWYLDHGFTTWSGPYWTANFSADATVRALDAGLLRGADVGITANGGLTDIDPLQIADPDARNLAIEAYHKDPVANPFHPEVARRQDDANRTLMEFVQHFPQVRTAFFNTEIVDALEVNQNKGGLQQTIDRFATATPPTGDPKFVAPGVIADDDPVYRYHQYKYQRGNGLAIANARAATMLARYRPDIVSVNDPYREALYLDMFPGIGSISTWTYTNPDPKLMLSIETLRAACKPTGQIPMQTITLLNYPGELAPTEEWMLMGPGRLTVTTWITLSRAPRMVGYYYSSACNPQGPDSNAVPYATSAKLKELSERVFKPLGPMLTQLDVAPRRVAVLSSAAARVHGKSPSLLGGYDNLQIYHFYTVLAMAHLQADVVLDETIERFGLDAYDAIVLPKCDVLTESVYNTILKFQQRGGIVIADQYLGPSIPGTIVFDFDFTYRNKVSANAIEKNTAYAQWNDQLQPGSAELTQVTGVTALDDQRILESYAATLKARLSGTLEPEVWCDTPKVLINLLEKSGARYLVFVNDNRTYDDREGKYKAVLGKVEPISTQVHVKARPGETLHAYDLLAHKELPTTTTNGTHQFQIDLDELGGTIVALAPEQTESIALASIGEVHRGQTIRLDANTKDAKGTAVFGLQPIRLTVSDAAGQQTSDSGFYCARDGLLTVPCTIAMNDAAGTWTVHAEDLTTGLSATHSFNVLE